MPLNKNTDSGTSSEICVKCSTPISGGQVCLHSSSVISSSAPIPSSTLELKPEKTLSESLKIQCHIHSKVCALFCLRCYCPVCLDCLVTNHNTHEMRKVHKNDQHDFYKKAMECLDKDAARVKERIRRHCQDLRNEISGMEDDLSNKINECLKRQKNLIQKNDFKQPSDFAELLRLSVSFCPPNRKSVDLYNFTGHLLQGGNKIMSKSEELPLHKNTDSGTEICPKCSTPISRGQVCLHSCSVRSSSAPIPSTLELKPEKTSWELPKNKCNTHLKVCDLYCLRCSCPVCFDCLASNHKNHATRKYTKENQLEVYKSAMESLDEDADRIMENIHRHYQGLREKIAIDEDGLLMKVDERLSSQTNFVQNNLFWQPSPDIAECSKLNITYCPPNSKANDLKGLLGHLLKVYPCMHRKMTNCIAENGNIFQSVKSFAIEGSTLYVASGGQLEITAFSEQTCGKLEHLSVSTRQRWSPSIYDMEVIDGNVFITDSKEYFLYLLEPIKKCPHPRRIAVESARGTLSRTPFGHVLLTQSSRLTKFTSDGLIARDISFECYSFEHAIETGDDEYVAADLRRGLLKFRGKTLLMEFQRESGPGFKMEPCYLASDKYGRIYVSLYKAQEVAILDDCLTYLVSVRVDGWPWGVCVSSARHLYVSLSDQSKRVHLLKVYDVQTD